MPCIATEKKLMCVHQKENGTTTFVCCHLVVAKRACGDLEEKHHQLHISHNERTLNTDNKKHLFFRKHKI